MNNDPSPPPKESLTYLGTGPIPAAPYYELSYYEREREAVFRESWLHVAHVSELPKPGDFIVRDLSFLGLTILLTRGKDGEIRAFHNVCTHRGTTLVWEAEGNANLFTCPYHNWTFANNGDLMGVPDAESFFDLDKAQCNLKTIEVDTCSGLIFVRPSNRPGQTLKQFLGNFYDQIESKHIEEFTGFVETRYRVKSNWKLAFDNFQEGYHIKATHVRTAVRPLTNSGNPFGHPVEFATDGIHRIAIWRPNAVIRRTPVEAAMLPDGGFSQSEIRGVFPNFQVNSDTGLAWTRQATPISVDETEMSLRFYTKSNADSDITWRFIEEFAIGAQFDVEVQDLSVINQNQHGIQSGALSHIHFQANEILLRHSFETIDAKVREFVA
ncbi:aromatic ring-hydroxylating oxygenase subunit alpha [Sphingopyxis flava]|uniref:Phenylpropionate dioxygenase, large terminal subunit n=1 Tax=Sphingopyxis flava TaxID=1507287 RepID=A0A1T5GFZ8_9SPHN|nr:aromatic ring-hydroxylating dioxygenase subunit alpha [Sphingopyxis flava]SKC07227.1 Phenylpropionate dioxygenase, large terminal subunit [Sphingopyxis flava]